MSDMPPAPSASPTQAPSSDRHAASVRNSARICRLRAPTAFSRPISPVRWLTATSMTFMISTPATTRLIAAIPARPTVIMLKIVSNVETKASCVTTVMSSSPAWRSLTIVDDVAPRGGDRIAVVGFDENAEHGGGVEDLLRIGDRRDDRLVDVESARQALLGQHTEHAAAGVADSEPLAERRPRGGRARARR